MPSLDRNIQVTTKRAKIPYNKPPLSISEQIAQLQKRGLVFIDLHKAADLLSHINYFRLEAYWYTFYDNTKSDHVFIHGTSFDFVWKHYCFDRRLRAHITHALERIEVSFRTQFAYHLSKAYGPFPLNDSTRIRQPLLLFLRFMKPVACTPPKAEYQLRLCLSG